MSAGRRTWLRVRQVVNLVNGSTVAGLGVAALDFNFAAPTADAAVTAMRQFHDEVLAKAL